MPFINEILRNLGSIINDLTPQQVHVFYEAVGHIIYCQTDRLMQEELIKKLMEMPNGIWSKAIDRASQVMI